MGRIRPAIDDRPRATSPARTASAWRGHRRARPAPPGAVRRGSGPDRWRRRGPSWYRSGREAGTPVVDDRRRGLRRGVHEDGQQVGPRHAVDESVMSLREQGPPTTTEPLDHPNLPQGLRAVELLRHHPSHEGPQLDLAARRREGGVAEVVVDVEMGVVHPDRAPEVERDEADDLPVAGDERELAPHHVDDVGVAGGRAFEDADGRDVHVADIVLDVQERRIERTQPVEAHGPPSFPRAPAGCSIRAQSALTGGSFPIRRVAGGLHRLTGPAGPCIRAVSGGATGYCARRGQASPVGLRARRRGRSMTDADCGATSGRLGTCPGCGAPLGSDHAYYAP